MLWTVHLEGGPRRVNHAAGAVGGHIYSFGGYCTGDKYNLWKPIDCYILDTVTLRWTPNPMSQKLEDYIQYSPEHSDIPYQRYGHTVVVSGQLIYLWGGRNDICADNTLYCFDTISREWLPRPLVSGSIPFARDGHTAVIINNQMYVFGGYEELTERFSNYINVLDLKTMVWKYLSVEGTPPSWRDFHSAIPFDNKMYVFGGRSDMEGPNHSHHEIYCNVIMFFDTKSNTWVKPETNGTPPEGRRSHSCFVYDNNIYIFGGYNGLKKTHFNDLYKFDPKNKVWTQVSVKGKHEPCPRRRQCCCLVDNRLFVFGGTSPHNTSLNPFSVGSENLLDHSDLYILDFEPTLKTLSILVAVENQLIQKYLPKDIQMDIDIMTRNNSITSRISTNSG